MKFAFVAAHRSIWPVAWQCSALGVSRSGFHAWLNRPPSARAVADEKMALQVRLSFWRATAPTARGGSGTMCWQQACVAGCTRSNG